MITSFTLANDNPVVAAYVGGGNTSTGVAYTYDTKKKVSTLLANPMKPVLDKIELGQMEEWNFTASDGTEIKGMICLPPSFDPNKKYPLIVYYYGGTTPTTRGITSPYCAQLFASRDYVVMLSSPVVPSGTARSSLHAMSMHGVSVRPMRSLKVRRNSVQPIRLSTINVSDAWVPLMEDS